MSKSRVASPDRHTFHKTNVRGLTYRLQADGSKAFYGYIPGRRRVKLAGSTQKGARAVWDELRGKAGKGERVVTPAKLRVAVVGEQYLREAEERLRDPTEYRANFERVILPEWGHLQIGVVGPRDVIELDLKLRKRGLAEATVANYLKPARGMFEHAVLEGYIAISPFAQVPKGRLSSCNVKREHHEWTTEEVLRLIGKGYELDERPKARAEYGLAIEMKVRTGARIGELFGARYCDINFQQGVWTIRAQWTKHCEYVEYTKTERSTRRVPLAPQLITKIRKRKLAAGHGDDDFLFANVRGATPMSHGNFRRRGWDEAVRAAGLTDGPRVTPHDARHAFASEMADLGLSASDVGQVLGHTSATITEGIYTHAFNREEREKRIRKAQARAMAGGARD